MSGDAGQHSEVSAGGKSLQAPQQARQWRRSAVQKGYGTVRRVGNRRYHPLGVVLVRQWALDCREQPPFKLDMGMRPHASRDSYYPSWWTHHTLPILDIERKRLVTGDFVARTGHGCGTLMSNPLSPPS